MRTPVHMPVIAPAKHHLVDAEPVQIAGRPDHSKLLAYLQKRLAQYPMPTPMPRLVPAAIFQALIEQIKRGDFD